MVRVAVGKAGREYVIRVSAAAELVYVRRKVKGLHGQRLYRWFILARGEPDRVEWKAEVCVSRHRRFWYWMTTDLPPGDPVVVGEMEGGWKWVMVLPFCNVWLVWRRVPVLGVRGRDMARIVGLDERRVQMAEMVMKVGDVWER